jgi:hypothetical protein
VRDNTGQLCTSIKATSYAIGYAYGDKDENIMFKVDLFYKIKTQKIYSAYVTSA